MESVTTRFFFLAEFNLRITIHNTSPTKDIQSRNSSCFIQQSTQCPKSSASIFILIGCWTNRPIQPQQQKSVLISWAGIQLERREYPLSVTVGLEIFTWVHYRWLCGILFHPCNVSKCSGVWSSHFNLWQLSLLESNTRLLWFFPHFFGNFLVLLAQQIEASIRFQLLRSLGSLHASHLMDSF